MSMKQTLAQTSLIASGNPKRLMFLTRSQTHLSARNSGEMVVDYALSALIQSGVAGQHGSSSQGFIRPC
jgi:hypothetical protein